MNGWSHPVKGWSHHLKGCGQYVKGWSRVNLEHDVLH